MTVGKNIRKMRKRKGMTQAELGKKIGVSYQQIGQYENGKRNPKLQTIAKIADALDVLPRDLIDKADLAELPEIKEVQGSKPRIRTSNIDYVKECLDSESVLNIIELTELFHENKDTLEIFWLLLRNFNLLNDTGKRLVMGYANDLTYRYKKDELDLIF